MNRTFYNQSSPLSTGAQAKAWYAKVSDEMERMPLTFWKHLAMYFFGAIFLGFVVKRCLAYVLFASLIAVGVLTFLNYIGAAHFDFSQLRAYFGIAKDANLNQLLNDLFAWAQSNISFVLAAIVGFIIGLQLG